MLWNGLNCLRKERETEEKGVDSLKDTVIHELIFLDFIFKIETDIPPLPWESQSSSGRPARRCLELDTMCSSVATQLLFYFFDILAPALFSISANTPFISLRAGRPALDALLDVDPE